MDSNPRVMEKQQQQQTIQQDRNQQQQQHHQQSLKCPRCDSLNTKFCYFNNYSLSQPRHFCKACKRYWTLGGTLRNVPVGGGCRKNKRLKRPSNSSSTIDHHHAITSSSSTSSMLTPLSSTSNTTSNNASLIDHVSPVFYGLPTTTTNHELNLPYPRFNSRVLDLHPQLNALGLGFSSTDDHYRINGFNSNSSLLSSYSSLFNNGSSTSTSSLMASTMASSLQQQQQKFMSNSTNGTFHGGSVSYETRQMVDPTVAEGGGGGVMKGGQNRLAWNVHHDSQNQTDQNIMGTSDPSLFWNSTNGGAWLDPTNLGPSVPSLI